MEKCRRLEFLYVIKIAINLKCFYTYKMFSAIPFINTKEIAVEDV
jgi:hypothetical protein